MKRYHVTTFGCPRWVMRFSSLRSWGSLAVITALLCTGIGSAVAPAAGAGGVCRVPHLTGHTLRFVRARAAHAGCKLRVKRAAHEAVWMQTVERQSPAAGRRASSVTVWLNPICRGAAAYGPGIKEPVATPGPTKLVSGFYLVGGPLATFSTPHCKRAEPRSGAGAVEVLNASGELVAKQTSSYAHFVEIPLPAGSFTIRGTFLDATINDVHPTLQESLVIPAGDTVRQDFFLNIP